MSDGALEDIVMSMAKYIHDIACAQTAGTGTPGWIDQRIKVLDQLLNEQKSRLALIFQREAEGELHAREISGS